MPRARLRVRGVVQGVGFRPFVYRLALEHALTGWVRNQPDGVVMELQGGEEALVLFREQLVSRKPGPARIDSVEEERLPEASETEFVILASGEGQRRPSIPADLATCEACLGEILDPAERRHRYAFTNCTHCGPRYSIIEGLPYDRPRTSMKAFPLCEACRKEYEHVLDRRFHAQPVACAACGPKLRLLESDGQLLSNGDDALQAAAASLVQGKVLALKGLGGFQLLVDATQSEGVTLLRSRKRREEKPFAVMFPDLASLEAACEVGPTERTWLQGPEAPILLLKRREGAPVAHEVAPRNPWLGCFLPYTPLHHLLLREVGRPLVCTSGNLSEEPMAIEDEEALARLGQLADRFLMHDRRVVRPVDDSVMRVDPQGPLLLRRARGFAPLSLALPWDGPPILALGPHQKATVCLLQDGEAVVSQHLGDLASLESAQLLERTVEDMVAFYQVRPGLVACDLHPDYATTRLAHQLAAEWEAPLIQVQHHHAHGASVMAEVGLEEPTLALTWDGTGLGADGTLWGGEALRIDRHGYARLGHLKPFALPGSTAAVRDPRRSAVGLLLATLGEDEARRMTAPWLPETEFELLSAMARKGLNSPTTTSIGRLFDAVAALLGIRRRKGYEGQAAMELEWACVDHGEPYAWEMEDGVVNPAAMLEDLVRDGAAVGAARFHATLAEWALAWARQADLENVVLSGGCFQNARLLHLTRERLMAGGFRVHIPKVFPPNDGAISLGQAWVAARAQC